jgi:hypothetical protein
LRSDAAFSATTFKDLYLYAWDEDGNFGRWGISVPTDDEWQIVNHLASTIAAPWNSPGLPDLSRISRLAFYQYGMGEAPVDAYTATIYIDDLTLRDGPLTEFPLPAAPRELIENFEGYADDAALRGFYEYVNGTATTVTTAALETPAPQGNKALKLGIDFSSGQYPWGSVRSASVAPFSFPSNAVLSVRFKGDPALAGVTDDGTSFWVSFYDKADRPIHFVTSGAAVANPEWTTLELPFSSLPDTSTVDVGNLVKWRILVQGWTGTPESTELPGAAFYIDDIRIVVPTAQQPSVGISRVGKDLTLNLGGLTAGKSYDVKTSPTLAPAAWTTATTINATSATASWAVTPLESKAFYQLIEK